MNDSRDKLKAAIAVNAIIVALEVWAVCSGVTRLGPSVCFTFYTECSNLFAGVACAVCAVAELRELRGGAPCGRAVRWLKYSAACCLLMTLFVVVFVLIPMLHSVGIQGMYLMLIDGVKPITHLGAPLLVAGSYIVFEADRGMSLRQSLVGFVPTLAYAAVAYPCNILRVWNGPYPFFQVWNMPVWMSVLWFVALFFLAFGLCQIPRLLARRYGRGHGEPA